MGFSGSLIVLSKSKIKIKKCFTLWWNMIKIQQTSDDFLDFLTLILNIWFLSARWCPNWSVLPTWQVHWWTYVIYVTYVFLVCGTVTAFSNITLLTFSGGGFLSLLLITYESAIATIDAKGLRNALASFDTRALRSAIDFTIKGKLENQNIDLRKTIF